MSAADEIKELKKLLDEGIITEEEFNNGKKNILRYEEPEKSTNNKKETEKPQSSKSRKKLVILVLVLVVSLPFLIDFSSSSRTSSSKPIQTTTTVTIDRSKAVPKTTTTTTTTTIPLPLLEICYNQLPFLAKADAQYGNNSLFLDGYGDGSGMFVESIAQVLNCVGVPKVIISRMENTNALMGIVEDEFGIYEISWSYSGSAGLDILIKEK